MSCPAGAGNTLSWEAFQHPRRPVARVFPKGWLTGWGLSDDLEGPFLLLRISWCQCPNPSHQIKYWKKKIFSLEWRELTSHLLAIFFDCNNLKIGSLQQYIKSDFQENGAKKRNENNVEGKSSPQTTLGSLWNLILAWSLCYKHILIWWETAMFGDIFRQHRIKKISHASFLTVKQDSYMDWDIWKLKYVHAALMPWIRCLTSRLAGVGCLL